MSIKPPTSFSVIKDGQQLKFSGYFNLLHLKWLQKWLPKTFRHGELNSWMVELVSHRSCQAAMHRYQNPPSSAPQVRPVAVQRGDATMVAPYRVGDTKLTMVGNQLRSIQVVRADPFIFLLEPQVRLSDGLLGVPNRSTWRHKFIRRAKAEQRLAIGNPNHCPSLFVTVYKPFRASIDLTGNQSDSH